MNDTPYTGPREALWDGSDPGWVLVNVKPNVADVADRYVVAHSGRGEVALFANRRQAREVMTKMQAARVPVVPILTCQEQREWEKVRLRQTTILARWGSLMMTPLIISGVADHYARFGSFGRAACLVTAVIWVFMALQSWWLWWRSTCPGGRLGFRFWSKAGRDAEPGEVSEDDHAWPPPPRRPSSQ